LSQLKQARENLKKNARPEKEYITGLKFIKEYNEKKKEDTKPATTLKDYNNKKAEENDSSESDRRKEEETETIDESIPALTGKNRRSIPKKGRTTLVLNDYKRNLDMRKFTEEKDWWQSVIDTFPKDPETGVGIIPPIMKRTIFEVEDPKEGLIRAFKENIDGKKDNFYNVFGTAKLMIKRGICHHLLPQIYADHLMPLSERNRLQTRPKVRKSTWNT